MILSHQPELAAALDAARLAGRVILEHYARFEKIADAPANISTIADKESQEVILRYLRRSFPGDAFCAEETTPAIADAAQSGPRLWVVDPIDGTRGFARKNGEFSVMIALADEGKPAVGVVFEPARQRLTYAIRGGGCWRLDGDAKTPVACRVSAEMEPASALLTQSHSKPGERSWPAAALRTVRTLETYSAGIKLALVARGEADIYVNTYAAFHDWDICAGDILVTEAGGVATGLAGEELRYGLAGAWQRHGLVAANRALHAAALPRLQR